MERKEELINIDPKDSINEDNYPENYEEFRDIKEYDRIEEKYCITDVEIGEKVVKCEILDSEEKKKFWEVLKKYREIFSKERNI